MRLLLTGCTILILFTACVLSGEQEEQLNKRMGRQISAHNRELLLELIGGTESHIVRFYKEQGDSVLIHHFRDYHDGDKTYLDNPVYRETRTEGKLVQRKYWVEYYTNRTELNHRMEYFALSDDGGDTWFFAMEKDYYNPDIKGFRRLFGKTDN